MRFASTLVLIIVVVAAVPCSGTAQVQSDSTYQVQSGDTLFSIGRQFDVSVQNLRMWNDLEGTALRVGQTLRIRPPRTRDSRRRVAERTPGETVPRPYGRHSAQPGETYVTLALRLGTTADTLFALNDETTDSLRTGEPVRLPRRFGPPTHVVQSGETLYSIAGEYGVSVRALRATNDLDTTAVASGQRLRLPTRAAPDVPPPGQWASPDTTGRVAIYPEPFEGRLTASGEAYDPKTFVVSHPSLPYGSVVLLSASDPARHTFARVTDRGPLTGDALLDVSAAIADRLGIERDSTPTIELRTVWINDGSD